MRDLAGPEFAPGTLVRTRGRDWVVLPEQEPEVLRLRPLSGTLERETGLFLPLERHTVQPTSFQPPDPETAGDAAGGLLLSDAARLNLRSGAAPFRSLGRISVRPRPYQFVPLIMALRLDPVRLLVADDVGVGKTIEAGLIARELLDRGLAKRLAVICPAHLCEQWESELREKFAIDAKVVQPSRIARLERELPRQDLSIYQYYPHLILSIDFVKTDRMRQPFLDNAPDLIIIDEAHMATRPRGDLGTVQHQRYNFVRELAQKTRHLILVTATPHSGIEESYRSLLGLLDPSFDIVTPDATQEIDRRILIPNVVQRRRSDLVHWLGTETPFPARVSEERSYPLSADYRALFEDVLDYCRESVETGTELRAQQRRVRHWAAIALLRSVLSSPYAAVSVLSNRARRQGYFEESLFASVDDVDAAYRPQVLDLIDQETTADYAPTAPLQDVDEQLSDPEKRRLARFLRRALDLAGDKNDRKLTAATDAVGDLLDQGFHPIVFCRFIPTAKYLEDQLPKLLGKRFSGLRVKAVTGEIGDEQRRVVVAELGKEPVRVLVATDCLSEGINLQEHFDAVVHFDLPWNPNRLEQREGRVDRFGQRRPEVKTVLIYGADNPVDIVVLDVLIRKAQKIRQQLGVAVPIPAEAEQVVEAVVDSVLLRRPTTGIQLQLAMNDPEVSRLHDAWDTAVAREGRQRAFFSQHGIKPDEVAQELEATDPVLGDPDTVQRFITNAVQRFNGTLKPTRTKSVFELNPGDLRSNLSAAGFTENPLSVAFDSGPDALVLGRTHPVVASFCDAVMARALTPGGDTLFSRCGAIFTSSVQRRTGIALLRIRYLLREQIDEFAEEVLLVAFERQNGKLSWLEPFDSAGRELLESAHATASMPQTDRVRHVQWAIDLLQGEPDWHAPVIEKRVKQLQESHTRLRKLTRESRLKIEPYSPDILGCYVLVPTGAN